jgi:hypothetical protein
MKCNKTQSKWCINKHGSSKIIDTFEMYQPLGVSLCCLLDVACQHPPLIPGRRMQSDGCPCSLPDQNRHPVIIGSNPSRFLPRLSSSPLYLTDAHGIAPPEKADDEQWLMKRAKQAEGGGAVAGPFAGRVFPLR